MNDIARIARKAPVKDALTAFENDQNQALNLAIEIQQIPAPTFDEEERADFCETKFLELGLADVQQDAIHNVFGRYPGYKPDHPPVIVSAHIDTVFEKSTDLTISRANGKPGNGSEDQLLYGPGLADNSMGVAGLLLLARTLKNHNIRPKNDIWFVANVAEEGLGDLKGMRSVVERFREATYIIIEGGSYGHVFHGAIGVRRYKVTFKTDGGHSWGNFGSPSAIHILGHFIADVDDIIVPRKPKTSYNVGVVEGGTTINSIASEATLLLDLRSAGPEELVRLVEQVKKLASDLDQRKGVQIEMKEIGNRPAGEIPADASIVLWAKQALKWVGCENYSLLSGSTDANIPISQGYPAVCIGLANAGNTHRLDEYLDPTNLPSGLGQLLLLTLAAAGY